MNKTGIEYLDYTWNPIAMRCAMVSPACDNCWHLAVADRLAKNPTISDEKRAAYAGTGPFVIDKKELEAPSRRKTPSVIGVQFMGDLFHESVKFEWFKAIMDMICDPSYAWNHTFIMLTKRPRRMMEFFKRLGWWYQEDGSCFPHVWIGVTAENQRCADERIPILLQIPAALHFVSVEPMLGPIHLKRTVCLGCGKDINQRDCGCPAGTADQFRYGGTRQEKPHWPVDWVPCGGESGSDAHPMHPDWPRSLRDQCVAAGVPFMFKQWGEWISGKFDRRKGKMVCDKALEGEYVERIFWANPGTPKIKLWDEADHYWTNASALVGKKKAGRLLDGKIWDQMP